MSSNPLWQALSSPRRREILRLVWDRELAAGDVRRSMPDVTFGAVSQQLSVLVAAGALDVRVAGRQRFYRARRDALAPMAAALEAMWGDALQRLRTLAELEAGRRGPRPSRRRTASGARRRKGAQKETP